MKQPKKKNEDPWWSKNVTVQKENACKKEAFIVKVFVTIQSFHEKTVNHFCINWLSNAPGKVLVALETTDNLVRKPTVFNVSVSNGNPRLTGLPTAEAQSPADLE